MSRQDSASSSVISSGPGGLGSGPGGTAAGSTANTPSRADQITYRFYLKTVSVLVDGRVTHFGKGERKKDRWFNLTVPDTEVHKADLTIYRTISNYTEVPPLLIAFILDTTDVPAGQGILWNRGDGAGVRVPVDIGKKKGIVLEQWTFRVTQHAAASASDMAPPTAYRIGIVHFRALYSFIRLLPAYRLFRRLRRQNNGLRLGIKLWAPEGYPADGLGEAWDVIERDLAGIKVPLDNLSSNSGSEVERYDFAPLNLFGSTYELGVVYRPNVEFEVEDMESVLSERFVDMDEEWFTPTVVRHRLESERAASGSNNTSRSASRAGQYAGSIPSRRTSVVISGGTPQQQPTVRPPTPGSLGAGKWNAMTEGLPFAMRQEGQQEPPSPQAAAMPAYRRLSAHSLQPFQSISASPTTSILRGGAGTPSIPSSGSATARAIPSSAGSQLGSQPMGRTSSFLSQSGRSHSHAQMASMGAPQPSHQGTPPLGPPIGASPPMPFPPSSSYSKRASIALASSSPFVGGSLERDTPATQAQAKRYSGGVTGGSMRGSPNSPMLRRTWTRESGLRKSLDEPGGDSDDIHAFLRALDSWTPPASVAAGGSGSAGSGPPPTPPSGSGMGERDRVPLTRTHVDDMLKRMAGSFQLPPSGTPGSGSSGPLSFASQSNSASRRSSLSGPSVTATRRTVVSSRLERPGLLSASRPVSTASSPAPTRGITTLVSETEDEKEQSRTAIPVPGGGCVPTKSSGEARSLPSEGPLKATARGPMVVRGGFGELKFGKPSSPSHSPVRDRGKGSMDGRNLERGLGALGGGVGGNGSGVSGGNGGGGSGGNGNLERIRSSVARGSLSRSAGTSQQSPVFEGLMAKLARTKLDAEAAAEGAEGAKGDKAKGKEREGGSS